MTDQPTISAEDAAQYLPDSLRRPPIIDLLNATPTGRQQIALIKSTVAKGATDAEVAQFLELCAQYGLDWNAHEAWCAVSQKQGGPRSILLMVGRNGLRKIAMRNGMLVHGDVVRKNDSLKVSSGRSHSGRPTRVVEHSYEGGAEERGEVVGAWAQVLDAHGEERGYFFAAMGEYRPTSEAKLKYSPWGSQESTMILAAAERQAIAQATPLGGIVAQGELDRPEEVALALTAGTGSGEASGLELPAEVEQVLARAEALGVARFDRATVEMEVDGQPAEFVAEWVASANGALDEFEAVGTSA